MPTTVRVWDLPTRIFHWALATCVLGSLATAWIPGAPIEWHAKLGYAILALLAFRLVWGLVGGHWSRFASFLYSPGSTLAYLRGQHHPDHLVGHNPLGALSVFAMLLALAAQVGTGLVSDDEIAFTGPLNRYVSSAKALAATWYHEAVGQWLVLALVVLHVGAIVFYAVRKRENLVRPMLRGDKEVAHATVSSADQGARRALGLLLFGACAGAVWWVVR
ncbi:cytochrome b/b6 domain-containing protein [Ramlibacter sp. MMS24-I3-19]|uniref:cytochrome b/b6 domain-containing protein n=1 Tax=Ramlibacter sp. MMS24-I3-19 TaxID=3416606 RepID=UPI003D01066F